MEAYAGWISGRCPASQYSMENGVAAADYGINVPAQRFFGQRNFRIGISFGSISNERNLFFDCFFLRALCVWRSVGYFMDRAYRDEGGSSFNYVYPAVWTCGRSGGSGTFIPSVSFISSGFDLFFKRSLCPVHGCVEEQRAVSPESLPLWRSVCDLWDFLFWRYSAGGILQSLDCRNVNKKIKISVKFFSYTIYGSGRECFADILYFVSKMPILWDFMKKKAFDFMSNTQYNTFIFYRGDRTVRIKITKFLRNNYKRGIVSKRAGSRNDGENSNGVY